MKSGVAWALLMAPPIVAATAFFLEARCTYGIQDRGIAKHRRKLRIVGWGATAISALVLVSEIVSLIEHHQ